MATTRFGVPSWSERKVGVAFFWGVERWTNTIAPLRKPWNKRRKLLKMIGNTLEKLLKPWIQSLKTIATWNNNKKNNCCGQSLGVFGLA